MYLEKLSRHQDWGILILRLAVALLFLYHGSQKWALWSAAPGGMPSGMLSLMRFLSIVEPIGAIAVAFGFLTRWATLGLGIIMLGAINTKITVMHMGFVGSGGAGWEFDTMILASLIALLFIGAGKISIDAMMMKKRK